MFIRIENGSSLTQLRYNYAVRLLTDCRWNRGCKVPELPFVRDVAELLSVMMMASIGEPHERPGRLAMAQLGSLGYVVDDLFDEHGSLDELRVFAESLQR